LLEIQEASSVAGFGHVFPPDKYPFPSEAVLDRWQKALDDSAEAVRLAELDGAAVGLAAMRAEWLDALYVVPSCWGTGVGPRLHDHAVTWIRDFGCRQSRLWVLEQNTRARRFYVVTPVLVTTWEGKHWWWYLNRFWWDSEGLDAADVQALILQREMKKQKTLERARAEGLRRGECRGR
jgi:GNAT superfamily N-acetyltransferase